MINGAVGRADASSSLPFTIAEGSDESSARASTTMFDAASSNDAINSLAKLAEWT